MSSSPFNTFGAELRASYNKYKAYTTMRTQRRQRVIDIFFNEMIRSKVKPILLTNATAGRTWGFVYTYPKDLYVVLNQEFGKKSSLQYSNRWIKDGYHIYELIHDDRFVQLMAQVEQELSDAYTIVRMYRTEKIDNEGKYSGIWVEWKNITFF